MKFRAQHVEAIILLIIVYLFWIFTTPIYSNRLAFLATIRFEKILAGTLILLVLASGRLENLFHPLTLLALGLFGFMMACDMMSPYSDSLSVEAWRESYWKKLVLLAVIAAGLRRPEHLHQVFKGLVLVVFFYQLYSWFDFLRGGSYVYQQGLKRMCGTWSGGGIGVANAFGSLSAFAIPFYVYWFRTADSKNERALAAFGGCVSFLSIIFSGTRGALVVAIAYLLFTCRKTLFRPKLVMSLIALGALAIPMLPAEYKHRYWDLMLHPSDESQPDLSRTDRLALDSGKGRLQGLIIGFELALQNPVFGIGPERSAAAARALRIAQGEDEFSEEEETELHNLYGQTAAELGFVGLGIWLALIVTVLRSIVAAKRRLTGNLRGVAACDALSGAMFVMLAYGMFSHSLYDWRWPILFGCTVGLMTVQWEFDEYDDQ